MEPIINFLEDIVPIWLLVISIAYVYLLLLFYKLMNKTNELSEKQSEFLKNRVEVIEKTTNIYEKTFLQQEKSIEQLNIENEKLKTQREKSLEQLKKENDRLKTFLNKSLRDFQKSIKLSDNIGVQSDRDSMIEKHSILEENLKTLQILYSNIKPLLSLEQNLLSLEGIVVGSYNIQSLIETRATFEHVLRAVGDSTDTEFEKAREHLIRAGFDAADSIIINKLSYIQSLLNQFNTKTISHVYPKYFTEVRPLLKEIKSEVYERSLRDTTSTEDLFLNYIKFIDQLLTIEDEINQLIPKLEHEGKNFFHKFFIYNKKRS